MGRLGYKTFGPCNETKKEVLLGSHTYVPYIMLGGVVAGTELVA